MSLLMVSTHRPVRSGVIRIEVVSGPYAGNCYEDPGRLSLINPTLFLLGCLELGFELSLDTSHATPEEVFKWCMASVIAEGFVRAESLESSKPPVPVVEKPLDWLHPDNWP